jgi:hypothetical protein
VGGLLQLSAKAIDLRLQLGHAVMQRRAARTDGESDTLIVATDAVGQLRQFHGEPGSA